MKAAISANGKGIDASLDPAFGRCKYFFIYDTVKDSQEIIANPGFGEAQGAGGTAVDLMKQLGVNEIITGRVGLKSMPLLRRAGISVSANRSGKIADIIDSLRSGSTEPQARKTYPPTRPTPVLSEVAGSTIEAPTLSNVTNANPLDPLCNPAGYCYCGSCGYRCDDTSGVPCFKLRCPHCNRTLERKYR